MWSRIKRLSLILLAVGITLYLIILNPEKQTIFLSSSYSLTTYSGVILLLAFISGVLTATVGTFFLSLKGYLREKALQRKESETEKFIKLLSEARAYSASGESGHAKKLWERFSGSKELEVISLIEQARLEENPMQALKLIEYARTLHPNNTEVLFEALKANKALGNYTAALDNANLLLIHHPSKKALLNAKELALYLGKFGDVKEYDLKLQEFGEKSSLEGLDAAELQQEIFSLQGEPLLKRLKTFLNKYPHNENAQEEYYEALLSMGRLSDAAQVLSKRAESEKTLLLFRELIDLWVNKKEPKNAIAAAKRARDVVNDDEKIPATLELVRLYISYAMLTDAKAELETLSNASGTLPVQISTLVVLFKATIALKEGNTREAISSLENLHSFDEKKATVLSLNGEAPNPMLSTP